MRKNLMLWQKNSANKILVCLVVGWNLIFNTKTKHPVRTLDAHYPRFTSFSSRSFPRLKKRSFPLAQKLVKLGRLLNRFPWQDASFSVFTQWNNQPFTRRTAWHTVPSSKWDKTETNSNKRIVVKFSSWLLHLARPRECVWGCCFCSRVRGSGRR